jgi:4-amino-4-deoxy-L-arabinose transferase-like glycosyltransferase
VSRRPAWLDPASASCAIAFAIALAIANGVWILVDNGVPAWDQAHYLSTTLQYQQSLESGGPIDLLRTIHAADPGHGPLYTVLLLPFFLLFGASASSAMALNLVLAPVLYLCAGEIAWTIFRSSFARLLTMFLVASMPIMIGLYHNVLQEFALTTLATVSLLLLLRSERFERRWTTWAMALAMGLGTLTKVTFPAFVIGPFLVVLARAALSWAGRDPEGERRDWRPAAFNLGIAALVLLVVAGAWYGPNFSATVDYVRSTTSGPLAEGAGPKDPVTFHAIASFTTGVVNFNISWAILGLGLLALALDAGRVRALLTRPRRAAPLWSLAFLLAWVAIPFLSVALAHNQDVRLMAPAFPGVAVLVAGAVAAVEQRRLRLALTGLAALLLAYTTVNHVTDVTPGFMPERAQVALGSYEASLQLDSKPIGYERLPGDDYATPIFDYIEEIVRQEAGGLAVPRSVCMLESQAVVNSNTFGFIAAARGDPFVFADVVSDPGGTEKGLEEVLSGCNFALYIKQPRPTAATKESRIVLVNEPYAANHMTPRLFALFRGPSRTFPVADASESNGNRGYLDDHGGETVRVMTRTPGEG